jgi:hypothetical protein
VSSFSKAFRAQQRVNEVNRQGKCNHAGNDIFHSAPLQSVASANKQQAHGEKQKHDQNEYEVKHG